MSIECFPLQYFFIFVFFQENIVTVPNFISLGRIVLSPVLGYLVVSSNFTVALGVFAVAGLTDLVRRSRLMCTRRQVAIL